MITRELELVYLSTLCAAILFCLFITCKFLHASAACSRFGEGSLRLLGESFPLGSQLSQFIEGDVREIVVGNDRVTCTVRLDRWFELAGSMTAHLHRANRSTSQQRSAHQSGCNRRRRWYRRMDLLVVFELASARSQTGLGS